MTVWRRYLLRAAPGSLCFEDLVFLCLRKIGPKNCDCVKMIEFENEARKQLLQGQGALGESFSVNP